jgi:hypothetical protein
MKKPDLDAYLSLVVRALPDAATTAQTLSAVITLVETAKAALRDDQPDNVNRADTALTVALGALTLMNGQFDKAADWVRSTVAP